MTVLTTERLVMTPAQESDFDEIAALWADPAFAVPLMPQPLGPEMVWTRLLRDIGHWRVRGHGNWTLRLRDGGDYVGSVGVLDYRRELVPPLDAPELGWGLAPRHQGQGLASEAVGAALAWCDTRLRAPRTVCIIDPANLASLTLAARVGYLPLHRADYRGAPIEVLHRMAPSAA